jgi:hypothetical protein
VDSVYRTLLLFLFLILFQSCLFDKEESPFNRLQPLLSRGVHSAFPNDFSPNDSLKALVPTGIVLHTQPGGDFKVQLGLDSTMGIPQLRLYSLSYQNNGGSFFVGDWWMDVEGVWNAQSSLWEYSFMPPAEAAQQDYVAFLVYEEDYYAGAVSQFLYSGQGLFGNTLDINLIILGSVPSLENSDSVKYFSDLIKHSFANTYGKNNTLQINEVRIFNGHQIAPNDFSSQEPFTYDYFSTRLDSLSAAVPAYAQPALDVLIIHHFWQDGVLGASPVYGFNLGTGLNSTIMLAAYHNQYGQEYRNTLSQLANTAVHEAGHFFGLRHTTSTLNDLNAEGDWSNTHDGLEDTPFCRELLNSDIFHYALLGGARVLAKMQLNCPDMDNIMFPTTSLDYEPTNISDSQLQIIAQNLSLYPR